MLEQQLSRRENYVKLEKKVLLDAGTNKNFLPAKARNMGDESRVALK